MSLGPIYDPSRRSNWNRWPSVWSLATLLVKLYIAGIVASVVIGVPIGLAWMAVLAIHQLVTHQ
jgi:tetrahydromethanopterin S-methyltransferase subunit B